MQMAKTGPKPIPLQDRLLPEPNSGCWLFEGMVNHNGYGLVVQKGRQERAHRLAWIEAYGPIPDGLFVCHHCDVPACCNPDHLFLGSAADNARDMAAKGRVRGGPVPKLECKWGHSYTIRPNGQRKCAECNRIYLRRHFAAKRAA
jgi:hypothetical protein